VDSVDRSSDDNLNGARPSRRSAAVDDKYKVTDDGNMKARATLREKPVFSRVKRERCGPGKWPLRDFAYSDRKTGLEAELCFSE
jgi:hypothetical protein